MHAVVLDFNAMWTDSIDNDMSMLSYHMVYVVKKNAWTDCMSLFS